MISDGLGTLMSQPVDAFFIHQLAQKIFEDGADHKLPLRGLIFYSVK